ncbi:transmembrane protease serine 4 isoform X2 [Rana temporaria]|uniref:transmembrane protease serine 4 isoform X2 n=1 Tax=Rana temporaria TaxID=8407 RepID=UPI001AADF37C|nr:transmembrane protease serine 4 isoform X2 [Rana temporaria]
MNPAEEEVNSASPLNTAGTTEATGNIRQPARISQPAANPARTTNTTTPGPNRVPPEPASVPAAANRPPAPRPAGPPRNPGPVRGPPGPGRGPPGPGRGPPGPVRGPPGPVRGPPGPGRGPPGPVRGHPRPGARPPHVLYKPAKISTLRRYCVPVTTAALVVASLVVIAILIKVVLDNYYFFCLKSFKFIPLDKWCDGKEDCANGEDELQCVQRVDFSNTTIVRLTNDSILQILTASGSWSYVCSDGFDANSAKSVCAEIGFSSKPTFSSVSAATLNGPFGNFLLSGGGIQAIPLSGACTSGSVISLKCIDCGVNHKKERIVGGQDTTIENSPWQCSLQYMGQHSCGCSIITPQIILTAAHCFPRGQQQTERWRVECGHARLSFLFSAQVAKIFVPTSYNLDHKPNDIALIKLKSDLSLSATVQPVCLPGFDDNLKEGTPSTVTGWGHTVEGGSTLASTLQGVTIFLISNELCNREYFGQILPTMICAGQTGGGKDTCQGDSGGPLVSLGPNSLWQQNGIVSWGDGCARAGKPGVYTKVAPFLSWITSIMKKELPPQ